MVTSTKDITVGGKKIETGVRVGGTFGGARGVGGGGGGNNGKSGGDNWTPDRYRIGMWVAIASILMLFTALTSAYIVRAGLPGATDWRPISMPPLVWLSTALIVVSSLTISAARKASWRGEQGKHRRWLMATLFLGFAFLGAQLLAWRQLVAQGIYLASNPHSSFFFVLTGLHGVHILGGLVALAYVLFRFNRAGNLLPVAAEPKRRVATDVLAIYWHFMDGLWIYLFLLLFLWR
ncbi:MAG: cytochrome c oxidase subunit 3 [Acidobacteriota bacterium]|nr:cytochrome c oxidase subunit 3 [Acidobacteriota bacterium]